MATGFPVKANYATGDVLSAANMNDLSNTLNLGSPVSQPTGSTLIAKGTPTAGGVVANTADTWGWSGNQAAGKNAIINGGFDIWQRGTSLAVSGGATNFIADRWCSGRGGSTGGYTVSRQATNDTTNLPNIQYCMRIQRNSSDASTQSIQTATNLETVNSIPFAGKPVTISFYARAGANYSPTSSLLTVYLATGTGTDQNINNTYTGTSAVVNTNITLTTTWQRFSFTGTTNSNVTEIAFYTAMNPTGTAGANDYYEITGVQLELGSTPTPFTRAGGNIQGELAACQRYYMRFSATRAYSTFGLGNANSTTQAIIQLFFPVQMRTDSTTFDYSNLAVYDGGAVSAVSAVSATNPSANVGSAYVVSTGLTTYRSYSLISNNTTSSYIGISAEL